MLKTKRTLVALLAIAVMATGAAAFPGSTSGAINDLSSFHYTDLSGKDGQIHFVIHNDMDQDAMFHGRLNFVDDGEGVRAQTQMIAIPVAANSSTPVTVGLEKGGYWEVATSNMIEWSGVRVEGDSFSTPLTRSNMIKNQYEQTAM